MPIKTDDLRAFALAAETMNMRRAADLLHISQPPLSRKIRNLENAIGARLFERRSSGLELTPAGRQALEIITPLLAMLEDTQERLGALAKNSTLAIGLSTGFEQGVYAPVIGYLKTVYAKELAFRRGSSIQLAGDVANGRLAAAWVALPVPGNGYFTMNSRYSERMVAVVPLQWNLLEPDLDLTKLNGRPFFWYAQARNPYQHERMARSFMKIGFRPKFLDEPAEHDVLLARIAAG